MAGGAFLKRRRLLISSVGPLQNADTRNSPDACFSATTGYDEATGIGSPIASTLVPYLASI